MKYYRCYVSSHLAAGCVSCLCFSRSQEKRGERDQKLKAGWQRGLCWDRRGSRAEIPISHPSRCHTAHPAGWLRSAEDGTGEEHINVPRKSRASGAGAVKSQAVPWQGKDRAPRPSSAAGNPSRWGKAPCPRPPRASASAQAPIRIP